MSDLEAEEERRVLAHLGALERLARAAGPLNRSAPQSADARFYEIARELVPLLIAVLRRKMGSPDSPRAPDTD